jgi:Bacterial regulatory proteins, tetR family
MKAAAIPIETKRGRPRSRQTNKAILKAAAEIVIASGLAEMTIEGVAERAGVGKASIYRRWPSTPWSTPSWLLNPRPTPAAWKAI